MRNSAAPRIIVAAAILMGASALYAYTKTTPVPVPSITQDTNRVAFSGVTLPVAGEKGREVKSLLNIRKPIKHGQFVWDEKGVPSGPVWLRVDMRAQTMSVFRSGHEIGTAVILYGADEKPTPSGTYAILAKRQDHRSNLYDAAMPYTLRLTNDGISIHGSNVRPNAATHGCVGVPIAFAEHLFRQVKVGDEVELIDGV